ncbi:MAG: hypothetical protein AB1452_16710 [Pseudomonadota bacterium]
MKQMEEMLRAALSGLPADEQAVFKAKYADADIGVSFAQAATTNQRRNALPKILRAMIDLPDGVAGPILEDDHRFRGILECIYVGRSHHFKPQAPFFHASGGMSVGDPTVELIADKIKKARSYTTAAGAIELLAYIDINAQLPDDIWTESLTNYLANCKEVPFRRIWVLDCSSAQIRFSWP